MTRCDTVKIRSTPSFKPRFGPATEITHKGAPFEVVFVSMCVGRTVIGLQSWKNAEAILGFSMGVDGGVQVEVEERSGMQRGSSSLLVPCSPVYPFSHRSD